jgi:hypothetical protein
MTVSPFKALPLNCIYEICEELQYVAMSMFSAVYILFILEEKHFLRVKTNVEGKYTVWVVSSEGRREPV